MTKHKPSQERSAGSFAPSLILGTLGTAVVVGAYFLIPGLQPLETVLLLIPIVFAALGVRQNILRGIMSAVILYIATGLAAIFHLITAPFVGAPFGDVVDNTIRALSYAVLTVIIWIALEAVTRVLMPVTDLPALGFLDRLGALVIYVAIGIMVTSITFNTLGFSGRWKLQHDATLLRPTFNQVFSLLNTSQSFLFSGDPPRIYIYDLE